MYYNHPSVVHTSLVVVAVVEPEIWRVAAMPCLPLHLLYADCTDHTCMYTKYTSRIVQW